MAQHQYPEGDAGCDEKADLSAEELCAIMPHGNGSSISDKAEAKAIAVFAEENTIPVLAYKGQIGYTATGSGIVDLIIGHHTLSQQELISPVGNDTIIESVAQHVLIDQGIVGTTKNIFLKSALAWMVQSLVP